MELFHQKQKYSKTICHVSVHRQDP
ncbi:unnamed protein product [Victoria cruziana]